MDDASFSQDSMTGGDPNVMGNGQMVGDPNAIGGDQMGGDPNAMGNGQMGGDPNAIGGDQMGGDPNTMGDDPMGGDPNAMGNDPIGGDDIDMDGGDGAGSSDDTISIINQLTDTDREAVRAYAESMLNRDETQQGGGEEQEPIMESVIFTKKQLNKIRESIGIGSTSVDNELVGKSKPLGKKTNSKTKNSPFSPPTFS